MAKTLEQMIRFVRQALGSVDEADLSDDDIIDDLNTSLWDVSDKFPFREKEKTARFSTVAGQRDYGLPATHEATRSLSIWDPTYNTSAKLVQMTPDELETMEDTDTDVQGFPKRYVREGCNIRLWPVPDDAYTVDLRFLKQVTDLVNDLDEPNLPRNWHEIVEHGALWRGYIRLNDWTRATLAKNLQATMINAVVPTQAKEERDNRYAGLEVLRNDYDNFIERP